jgi:hypothetical protein
MAQTVNLDTWLPMGDVIAQTGMSERTIYRMVTEGKLKQAQRPVPGRRPLSVFDPDDVAGLVASTMKPNGSALQTVAQTNVLDILRQALHPDEDAGAAPLLPSELQVKLYLTEAEAVEYTGLGRGYIRANAKGKTIGPNRSTVYRRADLEKL